ncbi:hypothetical protein PLIIFM63780_007252 [Purpureocillium lilacinum]|nr:hypothetical protein PLIIFM63780_007252 [Purpureocillium lilacinum]
MSAVAMPFDPTFTMGPRPAFTWPGPLDSGSTSSNSILGTDLSSIISGSEPSMTPPSETKSLASSPPRTTMTPELQELKRRRDQVRRDSKISARIRRAESSSYTTSPPMSMGEVSNAISLPVYTTAPSSMSLMATPAGTLASAPFLQPYNPNLGDQSQSNHVFSPAYQPLQHGYGVAMEYPPSYTGEFA